MVVPRCNNNVGDWLNNGGEIRAWHVKPVYAEVSFLLVYITEKRKYLSITYIHPNTQTHTSSRGFFLACVGVHSFVDCFVLCRILVREARNVCGTSTEILIS